MIPRDEMRRRAIEKPLLAVPRNALLVEARTACDCGCKRPARIEFQLADARIAVNNPADIDYLIDELIKGRTELWGPWPGGDPSVS